MNSSGVESGFWEVVDKTAPGNGSLAVAARQVPDSAEGAPRATTVREWSSPFFNNLLGKYANLRRYFSYLNHRLYKVGRL